MIRKNLTNEKLLVKEHRSFYQILEGSTDIKIVDAVQPGEKLAVLGVPEEVPENYQLSRIITSPMRDNSDIIYLYTYSEVTEGE